MQEKIVNITTNGNTSDRVLYIVTITEYRRATAHGAYSNAEEAHTVLRWQSNDRPVPMDIMEASDWFHIDSHRRTLNTEQAESIAAYTESRKHISNEQRSEEAFERRAAFGPGEDVVNIFTGERYTT
jgi:hypothetical protein